MSIIVVEGCDGSGKTTLVERAREGQRERYFIIVRAARYPPNKKIAFQYLQWVKNQRELDVLLDRIHFISDRIYGPILRNEDLFADMPLTFGLESVTAVVYCRPPAELIQENVNKNHQMKGVAQNIDKLIENYDIHMRMLKDKGVNVVNYDYTQDEPVPFWRHVWGMASDANLLKAVKDKMGA